MYYAEGLLYGSSNGERHLNHFILGDPNGIRTRVFGMKARYPNR